jgi:membrane-associated protease RseP (regulator of RpoE activity)
VTGIPGRPAGPGPSELDRIKSIVSQRFPVYETRIAPYSLILLVHADPSTMEARFDELRREMWPLFYVPQIRVEQGEHIIEVVKRPPQSPYGSLVNLILLGATIVSTIFAGAFLWVSYRGGTALTGTDLLWGGIFFAAPLMLILGLHELAHYWMARRHQVDASFPFFLPVPPPILIFGTFGAFISLREPFPDKKALLDIGAAGPIAGFLVAVPITLLGLHLSASSPSLALTNCGPTFVGFSYGNLLIGVNLFWQLFYLFVPGVGANLNPLAIAGWVGILVTAINLLPAGQLDGGHVARALLGKYSSYASWAVLAILLVLGVAYYTGWLIFAVFIFLVGMRHPPPLNDLTSVGAPRIAVGLLAVGILIAGFTVMPLAEPTGAFHLQSQATSPVRPLPAGVNMSDNLTFVVVNDDLSTHAYVVSASVVRVVEAVNNTTVGLNGSALQSFEANSSWVIVQPNGNVTTYGSLAAFTQPHVAFTSLGAGDSGSFTVTYSNLRQATVTIDVVVTQLCPDSESGNSNTNTWETNVY